MRPASSSLLAFNRRITSGILVWMGHPCWQRGFLQPRHWLASSMTCSAIVFSHFATILRVKSATKFQLRALFIHTYIIIALHAPCTHAPWAVFCTGKVTKNQPLCCAYQQQFAVFGPVPSNPQGWCPPEFLRALTAAARCALPPAPTGTAAARAGPRRAHPAQHPVPVAAGGPQPWSCTARPRNKVSWRTRKSSAPQC